MTADEARTVRVRIRGRVQGVWFRSWTEGRARSVGLTGWVRNAADGSVEALFHGPPVAVDAVIEDCRQGPPAARVDAVEVENSPPDAAAGSGTPFRILG